MTEQKTGTVYLIGAGPGDPGLITVRGAELIGRADVVLYDGLANPQLLEYARSDAQLICVGKHGHGGNWTQRQIDDEVVRFARAGKSTARLKGGDTAIFARTAEEVDRLIEEGIHYEIVPGITAALAASAFTGIPVTHRDWSSAVAIVTGQLQPADGSDEAEESLDWKSLAHFPGTLVLYMGVSTAQYWSKQLIDAGKSPSTPVALVRKCSWPDQQIIRCDLGSVADTIASMPGLRPPIISIVGDVIRMAKSVDWFSCRPGFGLSVWVTSPSETGKVLSKKFAELGANVLRYPVIEIGAPTQWDSIDYQMKSLDRFDWIVFSSHYGVDGFFGRMRTLGLDGRCLHRSKLAAVGSGTAHAIAKHGMVCDLVPQTSGAESIAEVLKHDCRGKRILFVRNPDGETIAMERLSQAGAMVESLDIYRQVPTPCMPSPVLSQLEKDVRIVITATSKNIAKQAVSLLGEKAAQHTWLSLSPAISSTLRDLGCDSILTAKEPSFESLTQLINSLQPTLD